MYTDLFLALLHGKNRRRNPILSALLYVFCPAAARWWFSGADPVVPFDITWQALTDFSRGEDIKSVLQEYGVDESTDEKLKQYYKAVKEWRGKFTGLAPELSVNFPLQANFAPDAKFGSSDLYGKFGGNWRYMFEYVRAWSILAYEWQDRIVPSASDNDSNIQFKSLEVALSAPGVRRPAYFPVWAWIEKVGLVNRTFIGLLVNFPGMSKNAQIVRDKIQGMQDQLRFALVQRSALSGDEPWPSPPEVHALDRTTGASTPFDAVVNTTDALKMVVELSEAARKGPHLPLGALQSPEKCEVCGFRAFCYGNDKTLRDDSLRILQSTSGFKPIAEEF